MVPQRGGGRETLEGGWNGISNLGASTTRTSESGTYSEALPELSPSLPSSSSSLSSSLSSRLRFFGFAGPLLPLTLNVTLIGATGSSGS